jgi:arylsulfatase A-like enzyme
LIDDGGGDGAPCGECNVLLISLDTVRADFLECYGSEVVTAPRICELAEQSLLFERAYSPAPSTVPALTVVMAGKAVANDDPLALMAYYEKQRFLAEKLRDQGYTTAAFTDHAGLGSSTRNRYGAQNLQRGFESFVNIGTGNEGRNAPRLTAELLDWIEAHRRERFFTWVHYFDPHFNYSPPEAIARRFGFSKERCGKVENGMDIGQLRKISGDLTADEIACVAALQRAEIFETDRYVGKVLDALAELGLADNTLVVVVADHGEEFMERGRIGHRTTVYNELIHVPLIFHDPARNTAGRISTPVSTMLVHHEIIEATMGKPVALSGRVVSRSYRYGLQRDEAEPVFTKKPNDFTMIIGDTKLIANPARDTRERFDLGDDDGERHDLFDTRAPAAQWERLEDWMAEHTVSAEEPSEEVRRRQMKLIKKLRRLGYSM